MMGVDVTSPMMGVRSQVQTLCAEYVFRLGVIHFLKLFLNRVESEVACLLAFQTRTDSVERKAE